MHEEIIGRILVDEDSLQQRVKELGQAVSVDYEGKDLVLIQEASFFVYDTYAVGISIRS